jgi:lipopolysaccharide transport system ATP-binding protein
MKPAVRVENLSKQYRIGTRKQSAARNLTEAVVAGATAAWRRLMRPHRTNGEPDSALWALKDVSFDVQPGEVVGIIGRNGAGKSTLLKILSRIVEPSEGRAAVRGRLGSLLEVGTGFHPELTGRENVYLNGSILGMSRREISRQFDEIVAFAEIDRFLDTPVKRYSSGMYVRLAFAVAAHLQPEILIVDEVLAVGDACFQKKCLGKMESVGRSGRTVLFVSHNLAAVNSLCNRCLYLANGSIVMDDEPAQVLAGYAAAAASSAAPWCDLRQHPGRPAGMRAIMTDVELRGQSGPSAVLPMGGSLAIAVRFDARPLCLRPVLGVVIKDYYGTPLFGINNRIIPGFQFADPVAEAEIVCRYEELPLMPGHYGIDLYLGNDSADVDIVHDAVAFEVEPADVFGSGKVPPAAAGPMFVAASWTLNTALGGHQYDHRHTPTGHQVSSC